MTTHPFLTIELARDRRDAWRAGVDRARRRRADAATSRTDAALPETPGFRISTLIGVLSARGSVRLSRAAR